MAPKAHLELQAELVHLLQYKPKFIVDTKLECPYDLGMENTGLDEQEMWELIDEMVMIESVLQSSNSIVTKVQFKSSKAIHVYFDKGSQKGYSIGRFIILDSNGQEGICMNKYYGLGLTNNEAKSVALYYALNCLVKLTHQELELHHPAQVFGDSQFYDTLYELAFQKSKLSFYILGLGAN